MEFGVSTWLWTSPFKKDSFPLFKKIKEMGFDCVEVALEDPSLIKPSELKSQLADNGLSVSICGAFGPGRDLTHDDPSVVEGGIEYIKTCLEFCAELGVNLYSGPMYSEVGKARMVPPEKRRQEWDRAVAGLHKVCTLAEPYGINLGLEALNRFESDMVNTSKDIKKLIGDINHPRAKACLDSFHMAIEEPNVLESITTLGSDLVHVQVSENYRGIPGTGATDWQSFKKGLEAVGYDGKVVIESFSPHEPGLAEAVCIWKPLAESQDIFAQEGLKFIKGLFSA